MLVGRDLEQGGAYQRDLEVEAERLGVRDRVVFAGERDADDVLGELDVVALPSWTEGLPLVVLEAMAHAPARRRDAGRRDARGRRSTARPGCSSRRATRARSRPRSSASSTTPTCAAGSARPGKRRVVERFSAGAMTSRMLELYDEVAA